MCGAPGTASRRVTHRWGGVNPNLNAQVYTRVAAILRFAGGHKYGGPAQADAVSARALLQSQSWAPFSPLISTPPSTYASTFPSQDGSEVGWSVDS